MKYMVMECHPSYAVVLDEAGQFRKVVNLRYQVGQTVTEVVEMAAPNSRSAAQKKTTVRWISSLAAAAACLILIFTGFFMGRTPYASVYMTINPEVRIDVNRRDMVVGLEGVNEDGKQLITGYDYHKKDLDLVVDELVDRAIEMDFLHEGGQITLALDATDNQWVTTHSTSLDTQLHDYLLDKLTVTIAVTEKKLDQITDALDDSNYNDTDYGPDATDTPATQPTSGETDYAPTFGQSDYTDTHYGESDYDNDPEDDDIDDDDDDDIDDDDDDEEDDDPAVAPTSAQSDYDAVDGQTDYDEQEPEDPVDEDDDDDEDDDEYDNEDDEDDEDDDDEDND